MKNSYGRLMLDIAGKSLSQEDKTLISNHHIGGLILFSKNFESFKQTSELVKEVKSIKDNILIAVDQEGGKVQRFNNEFTKIPSMQEVSQFTKKYNDFSLCKEVGWLTSSELIAAGIDINFAPVLDIDESHSTIIGSRAFSNDTDEVISMASAYIDGMHEAGMSSTGKHFPGHGGVITDSHKEQPEDIRSLDELIKKDIKPYIELSNKLDAIMCAHILFPNIEKKIPSFSEYWINEIIKNEINFNGIIFSDDLTMQGAGDDSCSNKAKKSIQSGCDMILVCNNRKEIENIINEFDEIGVKPIEKLSKMKKSTYVNWHELNNSDRKKQIEIKLEEIRS
tara:strand:- start:15281 stop:16291 length:1011 start_codon:yes stop_codon:yes gene_type:complete